MSQNYTYNSKGHDNSSRLSHRTADTGPASRYKTRQSEPPILHNENDSSSDSARQGRQQQLANQGRQHRGVELPTQPRASLTGFNANDGSHYEGNHGNLPHTSPKSGSLDWSSKVGSKRALQPGPTQKIDKQPYLSKGDMSSRQPQLHVKTHAASYQIGPSSQEQQSPHTTKHSFELKHNAPLKKSTTVPRFSDMGLMSSDDESVQIQAPQQPPITSPTKIINNDSRYSKSSEPSKPMGSRTMLQLSSEKEGFRKQKTDIITGNYSQFQKNGLRQSSFKFSDFTKGKELGSGKFGKVHAVKHIKTGFVCAMKTIPKAVISEQNIVNQFIRQLKIQSCLENPNIAKLYGFFDDKQNIYLLMELGIEGQLYKLMKNKGKFNETTTIYIVRQLCQATKYLHNLHILHRDIKPQNIVLAYGTIKLCDFGWAVRKGSQLRSTFCGTPLYVSPEILKGQLYDEKIDVWAIGILTYELLIGDIPFEIGSQQELAKIINEDIEFPSHVPLSADAKDFILKILKKNPGDRLKVQKLLDHPFLRRHLEPTEIEL